MQTSLLVNLMNISINADCFLGIYLATDVDECSRGISSCKRYGTCVNTLLSYECQCPEQGRYKEPDCEGK